MVGEVVSWVEWETKVGIIVIWKAEMKVGGLVFREGCYLLSYSPRVLGIGRGWEMRDSDSLNSDLAEACLDSDQLLSTHQ